MIAKMSGNIWTISNAWSYPDRTRPLNRDIAKPASDPSTIPSTVPASATMVLLIQNTQRCVRVLMYTYGSGVPTTT
jgi:hypothetical protein